MIRLGVNVDHIATIRQARRAREPDPVTAAMIAELAGAHQITAHLREDRRHMQDRDIRLLREMVQTRLNLEMASTEEMVAIALAIRPDIVTLVPEKREELTTEGGLNLKARANVIQEAIKTLHGAGIPVSLFINPDIEAIKAASRLGADAVELHTGIYAEAKEPQAIYDAYDAIRDMAKLAHKFDLGVHAGHGLTYQNVMPIAAIQHIEELDIGHSIVSRAVIIGMERAVKEMLALVNR